MTRRRLWLVWVLSLGAVVAEGCGYHVMRADQLFCASHVSVVPFAEREPNGLSAPIAQNLSHRLSSGGVRVSDFGRAPDATLSGTVHVGNAPSATLRGVQTYAVVAHVHAALSTSSGDVAWARDFVLREEFLPTDPTQDVQPLVSEARRRTALIRLAERAAAAVHEAMVLDNFAQSQTETPL